MMQIYNADSKGHLLDASYICCLIHQVRKGWICWQLFGCFRTVANCYYGINGLQKQEAYPSLIFGLFCDKNSKWETVVSFMTNLILNRLLLFMWCSVAREKRLRKTRVIHVCCIDHSSMRSRWSKTWRDLQFQIPYMSQPIILMFSLFCCDYTCWPQERTRLKWSTKAGRNAGFQDVNFCNYGDWLDLP